MAGDHTPHPRRGGSAVPPSLGVTDDRDLLADARAGATWHAPSTDPIASPPSRVRPRNLHEYAGPDITVWTDGSPTVDTGLPVEPDGA